tara:strand:+ start:83 stop:562 length:480 start_codon:yes stop_codon:yes gene_type:complete
MQLELFDWKEEKRCTNCAKVQPLSCFAFMRDKVRTMCKTCVSEYDKNRYINERDAILERTKQYARNNRHIKNAITAKRRAKKRNATPDWLTEEQISQIKSKYKKAKQLEGITGLKYEVDHIIPLTNDFVCGLHVPWNLQVITESKNRSKSNKFNPECFT